MLRYFTNQMLSKKLDVNLARWKRWSREFLPPDPLGGKQSGYARQYSLADALSVYLGGHLVASLHLSIPESKNVLAQLMAWMNDNRLMPVQNYDPEQNHDKEKTGDSVGSEKQSVKLVVRKDSMGNLQYWIQVITESETGEKTVLSIDKIPENNSSFNAPQIADQTCGKIQVPVFANIQNHNSENPFTISEKVLHISSVIKLFMRKLDDHREIPEIC